MTKRRTNDEFVELFKKRGNPNIILKGEYIKQKVKIPVQCKTCGREFEVVPDSLLRGSGCSVCLGMAKKTTEQFIMELALKAPDIEVLGEYVGNHKHIEIKCKKCSHIWSAMPSNLLRDYGCPKCNGGVKLPASNFEKRMKLIHSDIEILSEYISMTKKVRCLCKRCGNKWSTTPSQLVNAKSGCPRCARSQTSFLEQLIYEVCKAVFGEDNVISRDRVLIGMELDVVVMKDAGIPLFAIEPGSWTLHREENIRKRDAQKRKLCEEKNIPLLIIYDQDLKGEVIISESVWSYEKSFYKYDYESLHALIDRISNYFKFQINNIDFQQIIKIAHNNSRRMSTDDFKTKLYEISPMIEVCGEYNGSMRKTSLCCKICGYQWESTPQSLLNLKTGCPKCSNVPRKNTESFVEEMKKKNPNLKILGEYINAKTKVRVKCLKCNHVYEVTPDKLHSGRECPKCAWNKTSKRFSKAVINLDTGMVYESIAQATEMTKITNISACCRGVSKTAGGYKWAYYEKD